MTHPLGGRTALITGSSRGIGAAIAYRLAAAGAAVAIHGRDQAAVDAVVASIRADGGQALGAVADLTDPSQIADLRAAVEADLGPVDILIANAGGNPARPGLLEDLSDDDWRRTLEGNLTVTFLTVRQFLPGMKQRRRGTVVTLSSAAARRPTAQSPIAYAAAKAGIEALSRALALQAGPYGVRVNCLAPETILTERNLRVILPEVRDRLAAEHPIQRLGTPEDIAEAVLFLVSDNAAWISGITLDIAGGSVL